MRRTTLLLVLLLSVTVLLPASIGRQEIIPLASTFYEDMDLLYLIAGFGTPSGSRPYSKAEAAQLLASIDRSSLKGSGKGLYDSLQQEIDSGLRWEFGDDFGFSVNLDLAVEGYAHINADFNSQSAWEYSFVDRKPIVKARLDMALSDYFYTYADLQYGYGPYTGHDVLYSVKEMNHAVVGALVPDGTQSDLRFFDADTPLVQYTKRWADNLIPASKHFDFQWPKRAVFSLGTERLNFVMSRDKISWGNSQIGNFVLNNHVDYQEYLRFTTFSPAFKYETMAVFFDTQYSDSDHFQILLAHRLEFKPWKELSIAISENVMYKDDIFQMQYLNPAFILHNLNSRSTLNAIAHAEIAYVFPQSFRVYGQFALDQATAPNEGDNEEVAAWAASLGVEWARDLEQGVLATLLEASMATPHMYRRDSVDFLMARRYAGLQGPNGRSYWNVQKFDYIGSPYGGDAVVLLSQTRFTVPDTARFSLALQGVFKGTVTMYTDLDDKVSPYGTTIFKDDPISMRLSATATASYAVQKLPNWVNQIELFSSLAVLMRGTYLQSTKKLTSIGWDAQWVIGTSVSF